MGVSLANKFSDDAEHTAAPTVLPTYNQLKLGDHAVAQAKLAKLWERKFEVDLTGTSEEIKRLNIEIDEMDLKLNLMQLAMASASKDIEEEPKRKRRKTEFR
jgi:TolA-binding protein